MPIDVSSRLREIEKKGPAAFNRGPVKRTGLNELFQEIPEGGNSVVKGRDHASVAFIGHLKKFGMDYDFALGLLHMWNERFCKPPLDPAALTEKASRLWVEFADNPEFQAAAVAPEKILTFLDIPRMEEEAAKSAAQGWVMEGTIPSAGLVYITAPPAFGKTWVVLDLMRACLTGTPWLGRYPVDKTPVMYLDEEMGVARVLPRIQKIGIPRNSDLLYTNREGVKLDDKAHRAQICDTVKKYGIRIIVVDSLTRVHGLDEGSNKEMARLYGFMREIMDAGATLVICHHDRKGGQGDSSVGHDRSRGAGEIMAAADMVYSVEKREGIHKIVCTKSRLISEEDAVSCEFLIEDSEDRTRVFVRAVSQTEISNRRLDNCEQAVVDFLRYRGLAKTSDIKEGVHFSDGKVTAALQRLLSEGTVVQVPGEHNSRLYQIKPKDVDPNEIF